MWLCFDERHKRVDRAKVDSPDSWRVAVPRVPGFWMSLDVATQRQRVEVQHIAYEKEVERLRRLEQQRIGREARDLELLINYVPPEQNPKLSELTTELGDRIKYVRDPKQLAALRSLVAADFADATNAELKAIVDEQNLDDSHLRLAAAARAELDAQRAPRTRAPFHLLLADGWGSITGKNGKHGLGSGIWHAIWHTNSIGDPHDSRIRA